MAVITSQVGSGQALIRSLLHKLNLHKLILDKLILHKPILDK
jgi:hypothetical protein